MPMPLPKSKAMPKKRHVDSIWAGAPAARRHAAAKRRPLQPAPERAQAVEARHPEETAAPRFASVPTEVVDKWLAKIGIDGECARFFRELSSGVQYTAMGNYDVVMSRWRKRQEQLRLRAARRTASAGRRNAGPGSDAPTPRPPQQEKAPSQSWHWDALAATCQDET